MADNRVVLSSRVSPEIDNKVKELVDHYQKQQTIGKVTKRDVLEAAINLLHEKELKNNGR